MLLNLELQVSEGMSCDLPSKSDFYTWVSTALKVSAYKGVSAEVSIRVVDEQESQELNSQYRDKHKPTNVLSFPAELPDFVDSDLLGDLAICAEIVAAEAREQEKPILNHWAHLTIHGCLHLMGYDHLESEDAEEMESLEIKALEELSIPDPYQL